MLCRDFCCHGRAACSINREFWAGQVAGNEDPSVDASLSRQELTEGISSAGFLIAAYLSYPLASTVVQGFGLLALVYFAGITLLPVIILRVVARKFRV